MPSTSKSQQRLFGMAYVCKTKGECASKKIKDLADRMTKKELEKYASIKHDNLPEKVDEHKVIPFSSYQSAINVKKTYNFNSNISLYEYEKSIMSYIVKECSEFKFSILESVENIFKIEENSNAIEDFYNSGVRANLVAELLIDEYKFTSNN